MIRYLIAIVDLKANDIVGPIVPTHRKEAASRMFGDVITHPQSQVGKHVADHILVSLGTLDTTTDKWLFEPHTEVIITGEQWLAAQPPAEEK